VSSNFGEQLDDLFRSYETAEISVVTQNNASIDWDEISELKKKTIYKVLQELLTNMRTIAWPDLALTCMPVESA
jgi:glucose-6-phosphate-specific signal transduction histidine kinase